ncbi:Rieske (2Fe-2S) protein [Sporichthya brevicatena]|uniref:Cytochrome bc1 complex Rieske iron-sulfur subunit n=1 Tax=Sporichthya brevicatena TaxID=171442 RepID=A0ABN1GZV3_9ACTN
MTQPAIENPEAPARRVVVRGALALGLTAAGGASLAACGGADSSTPDAAGPQGVPGPQATPAPGTSLGPTEKVPVGGGLIFGGGANVVVTQPTEGAFHAFSSICTHSGCPVTKVHRGVIECPCHGSRFSIEDGSVERGPAQLPLPAVEITTDGGTITVA